MSDNDLPAAPVEAMLRDIEDAWRAGDSQRFASAFTEDADLVDVLGRITKGRSAIERLHRQNFDSIHHNSRLRLDVEQTRELTVDMMLAHVRGQVDVPSGPIAGRTIGIQTWLMQRTGAHWLITAFHNTAVRDIDGVPPLPEA